MKKLLYLFIFLASAMTAAAQPTNKINYQAIARDASGTVLPLQNISIRLTIEDGAGGAPLYVETHNLQTNQFGLFAVKIGNGTVVSGIYDFIDWPGGNQWLKVEMDPTGGNSYADMGESQLLAVPYSNYAAYAASGGTIYSAGFGIDISGDVISNTGDVDPSDDVTIFTAAGGDLSGFYPDPTINSLQSNPLSASTPSLNDVLQWNGAAWTSAALTGLLPSGTDGQTVRNSGGQWVANSFLYNTGSSIGIGTTSPSGLLHLNNPGGTAVLTMTNNFDTKIEAANDVVDGTSLRFYTTNNQVTAEKMRISNAGNVGIGTTAPQQKLHVNGTIRTTAIENDQVNDLNISSTSSINSSAMTHTWFTASTERMRISVLGNVGIGTSAPQQPLDVNGGIKMGDAPFALPGTIRFHNSDFEGYDGTSWLSLTSPKYQALSNVFLTSTVRNAFVYSSDSLVVNVTGTYLVTMHVNGSHPATYTSPLTDYDQTGTATLYKVGFGGILGSIPFFQQYSDLSSPTTVLKHLPGYSSDERIIALTAGDVLKLGVYVTAVGAPTDTWSVDRYTIDIIKLKN
jgi:hypothetical protein